MNGFVPPGAEGHEPERDFPAQIQRPISVEEQRARWEVRAAQYRAHELAEMIFGHVSDSTLLSLRSGGPIRGLLRLRVPFVDLDVHRHREGVFMASAATDPILSRVKLVYVVGPEAA